MEGVRITKRPKLKDPYLICAWPGMGEVAFKAATYLVEALKAQECAEISPGDFFYLTGNIVQEGVLSLPALPYGKFYYWRNKSGAHDLLIFISNAQPDLVKAEEYCSRIISVARHFKVGLAIGFAAMPQPIDHMHPVAVWLTSTSKALNDTMKRHGFNILQDGQISGMNGLFLGVAKREGIDGFCLLAEIPLYTIQIENPKASHALLDALVHFLEIKADLAPLLGQSQAMEQEINKLLDYLKLGSQVQSGPIGEDEIEKIKKTLGQLTRLPLSVKEKIDRLFEAAKTDISKANELKGELDKWNVYKDYEDKFLDLFKKAKEKDN